MTILQTAQRYNQYLQSGKVVVTDPFEAEKFLPFKNDYEKLLNVGGNGGSHSWNYGRFICQKNKIICLYNKQEKIPCQEIFSCLLYQNAKIWKSGEKSRMTVLEKENL